MSEAEEVARLKARIRELEIEVGNAYDGTQLMEGYDQCLQNLKSVTDGAALVTWQLGPVAGLEYMLAALRNMNVDTTPSPNVPYDWLSRWLVTDRVVG